jgi:transposase
MVAADDRTAVTFGLSPGQASDGVEGRALLENWQDKPEALPEKLPMAMDEAYEGDETRECVRAAGFSPVVPPKDNRKEPWEYDEELYKRRNEVERLFRKLKGFRRIFTRFEKLDVMFRAFLHLALAYLILYLAHHPARYMRKGAIPLLDDKHLHALKAMTPHKNGRLTKTGMEPVVYFSLGVLIPGSMSLLRPAPEKRTRPWG